MAVPRSAARPDRPPEPRCTVVCDDHAGLCVWSCPHNLASKGASKDEDADIDRRIGGAANLGWNCFRPSLFEARARSFDDRTCDDGFGTVFVSGRPFVPHRTSLRDAFGTLD